MVLFLTNSPFDWVIILVIVLILFGGRKIPALAKDLGGGIREFRQALLNPNQTQTTPEKGGCKARSSKASKEV
jgi:sec-independent protein translocase protein TatA